jgi:hypothetical protein
VAEDLDFSEILRSPLDEPERPGPWWPVLAGLVLGALAVIGGYAVAASGDDAVAGVPTTTTTGETALPSVGVSDLPFPPGYEPISDVVAAKPEYATRVGDELFVAVTTVFRRGFDAQGVSLDAGSWVLETATGEVLPSTAVVTDPGLDGVVSVVFPYPGEVGLSRLVLVERWERDGRDGSATVAVEGAEAERTDVAAVDLGGGVVLDVDRLVLDQRSGTVHWTLSGSPLGGDVVVFVRARQDGQDLATFFPSGGFFFREQVARPTSEGTIQLSRDQGVSGELADATELVIEASATLFAAFPANVSFDASDLPVATR